MTEARTFIVDVTIQRRYRCVIGGPNGSVRIEEDASDEDAAEAVVTDYVHLPEFMLPQGLMMEQSDLDIDSVTEVIDANAA